MLYNEPDFRNVDSILEADAKAWGFQILFLPKFHCELNFIEQCWGHAKRRYRVFPPSSKEDDLERNVVQSLDEVPMISMHRCVHLITITHKSPYLTLINHNLKVCNPFYTVYECVSHGIKRHTSRLGGEEISGTQNNSGRYFGPV
jgi:hypothetical protein